VANRTQFKEGAHLPHIALVAALDSRRPSAASQLSSNALNTARVERVYRLHDKDGTHTIVAAKKSLNRASRPK
jgi:hypothetical protein